MIDIKSVLEKHTKWLRDEEGGERANLSGADLSGANLYGADLYGALDIFYPINCPESGSFIGWKKARDNKIVKLEIADDAERSSATSRKCRCSKAKVISIENADGSITNEAISTYDDKFIYRVGETVQVDNFDDDRWNECSRGIHFFITREEAARY